MKEPFHMDKWGQIPLIPKAEGGDARWSVRPIFIALMAIVVVLVFAFASWAVCGAGGMA